MNFLNITYLLRVSLILAASGFFDSDAAGVAKPFSGSISQHVKERDWQAVPLYSLTNLNVGVTADSNRGKTEPCKFNNYQRIFPGRIKAGLLVGENA